MSETTVVAPLSINLVMDAATMDALRRDEGVAAMLESYEIDSQTMADVANGELRETIERIAEIKKLKAGFVAPAKQIIGNAEALFDPAIDAREAFAKGLRAKLTVFVTEQNRLADLARKAAADAARAAQQKAEKEAAEIAAKAAAQAKEQQRQADEARQRAEAAAQAGDAKTAANEAAKAAGLEERATATIENAEIKAMDTVVAAQAVALAPLIAPVKVAGFGLRDNWKAELRENYDEERSIEEIVAAMAGVPYPLTGRRDLLPLLKLDTSAADKLAKALKGAMNVPGLRAVNRKTSTSRAA